MTSVSFIVPVFNKSSFLKYIIESIKNQKGNFEKEYIFIDDGSTDDSFQKLNHLTKDLNNCKILKQKNKGSANATNQGIKLAKMKYLKFLDADDVILSEATISLLNILERYPDIILAYGLQRKVKHLEYVNLFENFNQNDYSIVSNTLLKAMRNSMFNPSQLLARTDLCKKVGGCDERIKFSQEYSLTLRLSVLGNFVRLNHPIAVLPIKAPGQISEKKNNQIYRVSKALELFIEDNEKLELKSILYAQRRITARAWRFARRFRNVGYFSSWFFLYLKGFFGVRKNILLNCKKANKVYEGFLD